MKIIAITSPSVVDEDLYIIQQLLNRGIDIIHLRKSDAEINDCRKLLSRLTDEQRAKIIVHDFPSLYEEFSLKGIHVNKNITSLPINYKGYKTRSCHSFEEIKKYKKEYDYLFLSPIFDSISKSGYKSCFSHDELKKASADGIIDKKVIALGGVTFDSITYLKELNFGGVAMIGSIYNIKALDSLRDISAYK